MNILMIGAVFAQLLVRPWSQTNEPLAARVAADFKGQAPAALVHYAVPPMSGFQRLPDAYPDDGTPGGTVRIVMAKDEYEPGSFLVYGLKDLGKVTLELSDFKQVKGEGQDQGGAVFPKENLDLKVVKCWYQNRNAWYSYFGDTDFKLCPELLLNDEDLIRTDAAKKANYARLTEKDGTVHEQWLNPPRQLNRAFHDFYCAGEAFGSMKPNFCDADSIRPVRLPKGEFRQFFLTARATKDTPAGLYRGEVALFSGQETGGKRREPIARIPVAIRILDFVLPKPMCYFDDNLPFYVNFYVYQSFGYIMTENGGDLELAKRQFLATVKNRIAHGDDINWMRHGYMGAEGQDMLPLMKEAGCRSDVCVAGAPFATQGGSQTEIESYARRSAAATDAILGHHKVYIAYGDEPPPRWLKATRDILRAAQKAGYKFILAGSDAVYRKAGYQYDWHNIAKEAGDDSTTRLWNQFGNSPHVAWYARQHVGAENPDFNRRQNGLAAYLSNYSALCNYAHHYGSYNDDTSGYRPMVYAYGQYKGVIDTLQWEGFREGVDDIRYATALVKLARKAAKSSDIDTRYEGNKALQYLAAFRKDSDDLTACRMEMIRYIQALRRLK